MKQRIKQSVAGVLTVAVILSVGATSAFAASRGYGRNFVDTNHNGVCDYRERACPYIDSDNDGICDNFGTGQGRGLGCRRSQ